jgi:hypothetical protein
MLSDQQHCAQRKGISWMSNTINFITALCPLRKRLTGPYLTVMNAHYAEKANFQAVSAFLPTI